LSELHHKKMFGQNGVCMFALIQTGKRLSFHNWNMIDQSPHTKFRHYYLRLKSRQVSKKNPCSSIHCNFHPHSSTDVGQAIQFVSSHHHTESSHKCICTLYKNLETLHFVLEY